MIVTDKRTVQFKTIWPYFTVCHTLGRLKLHTQQCHLNYGLKENDLQLGIFCDDLLVTQSVLSAMTF